MEGANESGSFPDDELDPRVADSIGKAFGLSYAEVIADLSQIIDWSGSNDDMLAALEHRHGFSAAMAVTYLWQLRRVARKRRGSL